MLNNQLQEFYEVAKHLRAAPGGGMVDKAVTNLLEEKKALEKELARLKSKLASSQGDDLASQAVDVKGAKVLAATLEGADAKALRETMDKLKATLKSAAIVLGAVVDGKVSLIAGVTADLTGKVKAGTSSISSPSKWAAKAAGAPTWRRPAGPNPRSSAAPSNR